MVRKFTIEDFENERVEAHRRDLAVRRPQGLAVLAIPNR